MRLFLLFIITSFKTSASIGINYGQLGNNLPSPATSTLLIDSLKASSVKIYDANPQVLTSLSLTNLQISIMVPNQLIPNISSSQSFSDSWIQSNLLPFYQKPKIRYLLVGNEVLSSYNDPNLWPHLVPAMIRINQSLKTHNISSIKVSTPSAMDILQASYPPSNGIFRSDISESVVKPLLNFLKQTNSPFYLDAYPYFAWSADSDNINLDYALFNGNSTYTDPVTHLTYTNLLDQMLDAVIFAMTKLGFPDIGLTVSETGWPTAGDIDEIGANIYNAATYNRNLVKKLSNKTTAGTPARPSVAIPTFVFSLFNENQKPGPTTERNWGLYYPNGTEVYEIDLGKEKNYGDKLLPSVNNEKYKGKIWCVVAEGMESNRAELQSALKYACGEGRANCDAIKRGGECYRKGDLVGKASYAFSKYWVKFRSGGGNCYFDGLAAQTKLDPSFGPCKFPSMGP